MSDISFADVFSHPVGCIFTMLTVTFDAKLIFMTSTLFTLPSAKCAPSVTPKESLPTPMLYKLCPIFYSKSFVAFQLLSLGLWSLAYMVLVWVWRLSFVRGYLIFPACVEKTVHSPEWTMGEWTVFPLNGLGLLIKKSFDHTCRCLFLSFLFYSLALCQYYVALLT